MPYKLTEDESVAFVAALLGGISFGPIPEEDGYVRGMGYLIGSKSVDREIRALLAASILKRLSSTSDPAKGPVKFLRGNREIDERNFNEPE